MTAATDPTHRSTTTHPKDVLPMIRPARRLTAALLPLLATALLATGCSSIGSANADSGSSGSGNVVLRVGDQKAGAQPLLQAAGLLDNLPYTIKWSAFTAGPPLLEAVNAHAIDVGSVGDAPPIFAAAADSDITIVSASQQTPKGAAILVPKDSKLKTLADLKGKKVAVTQGSSANWHLLAALSSVGLTFKDITPVYLQPADALSGFSTGQFDAWAIWDPYTAVAQEQTGARILRDGQGLVGGLSFQVASPSALKDPKKAKALRDYLSRIAEARVWATTHTEEWAKVWAEQAGISPAAAQLAAQRSDAQSVPLTDDVVRAEQAESDAFAKAGLIPHSATVNDIVDRRYNAAVEAATTKAKEAHS
jgi:sulfonate transport system substrate-binding protein